MKDSVEAKHVAVVGGGIIGICTAYYLSTFGFRVSLLEAKNELASVTSAKNAGRFCPTRIASYPLANPEVLRMVAKVPILKLRQMLGFHHKGPLAIDVPSQVTLTLPLMTWGVEYLYNCLPSRYRQNNATFQLLQKLCWSETSHLLQEIEQHTKINVHKHQGNIWVYGKEDDLKLSIPPLQAASSLGFSNWKIMKSGEAMKAFPLLSRHPSLVHSSDSEELVVYAGDDYSVDSRQFALGVAELAVKGRQGTHPVEIRTGVKVEHIVQQESGSVLMELESGEKLHVDAVVVSAGNDARTMAQRELGMSFPIEPARGYTLELVGSSQDLPSTLVDLSSGTMSYQATPLGKGVTRVSGFADFCSIAEDDDVSDDVHRDLLVQYTERVLPDLDWSKERKIWRGYRPTTPDFLPIVGRGRGNVFVNCGHGGLGWNMAAGTAKLTASIVSRELSPNRNDSVGANDELEYRLSPLRFLWFNKLTGMFGGL